MTMTLDQALALCEHASPMPHLAGQALRVLRDEIARLNELADRFSAAINEMTGPTFMGEPVIPHRDDEAVDRFARAMKDKLAEARAKGRSGWQDKDDCPQQRLSDMLRAHVEKGDPRDVANFCMFLHQRGESIRPAESVTHGEDGMQPSRPKPRMPVSPLGIEDFCFCNNEVSLQSVSGGAAPEGYLGRVRLKINGEFVSYVRESAQPAESVAEAVRCLVERWRSQGENLGPSVGHIARKACAGELEAALLASSTAPAETEGVCNRNCDCVGPCKMGADR